MFGLAKLMATRLELLAQDSHGATETQRKSERARVRETLTDRHRLTDLLTTDRQHRHRHRHILWTPTHLHTHMQVVTERRHQLNWDQRRKAANVLSERIDHFFKVDQVLRQHNTMIEAEILSDSSTLIR